ncbi:MAG: nucleotidyl transferase AbiEii/AbiGii toxin family protein [Ramlibacter sp.]|nr:nucleotidyl transferase AbiEii/AbiGii toxin family protein [Ramlibacter sp.]
MANLYTPTEMGFDSRLEAIDRCQVGLLRELAGDLGNRLILKGGMAMRAVFGSMRLTKDIDFDRDETISQAALKKGLGRLLVRAAGTAGIRAPRAEVTKDTATTVRVRLQGVIGHDTDVRFDVEVSGRAAPSRENLRVEVVVPPQKYAMAPFPVTTYTHATLAAMKVGAALSDRRNAPRDLYDLRDLIRAGADPVTLLTSQDQDLLEDFLSRAPGKLDMLTYALAQQELLPFLPPAERATLTEDAWIEATIMVAEKIGQWCTMALETQASAPAGEPASARPRP